MQLDHNRLVSENRQALQAEKVALQAQLDKKESLLEKAQFSNMHQVSESLTEILEQQNQHQQALALVRQLDGAAERLSETEKFITELQGSIAVNERALIIAEKAGQEYKTEKIALEKLGVEPEEAIIFGDNYEDDIEPAIKLGIETVLVKRDSDMLTWEEDRSFDRTARGNSPPRLGDHAGCHDGRFHL